MRVVQVIAPSPVGGAEQVVSDLSGALAREGAEVHLLAVLDPDPAAPAPLADTPAPGVIVHRLRVPRRAYLRERAAVADALRSLDPDVVHTHGYRADVIAGSACRAVGVPMISTAHGFTGGNVRNRFYEFLQRRALRRADAVVAVSRPLSALLRGCGVRSRRLTIIPNARSAPTELLPPGEARIRLGASLRTFHVGYIGRISHEKGPDIVIEALARLDDFPLEATFVGDGPMVEALKARTISLGIEERVRWAGAVPGASRLLRGFDVLVLGSRTEGTPIVVLEAMSAGIPLVVPRVGGIPDLVSERHALLVPEESPGSLARALRSVRDRPSSAARRAQAARRRFEEVSATDGWAARYLALYRTVTGGAVRGASGLARLPNGGAP